MTMSRKDTLLLILTVLTFSQTNQSFALGGKGNFFSANPVNRFSEQPSNKNIEIPGYSIGWKPLAPLKYRNFNYKNPSQTLMHQIISARGMFDHSDFDYYAPIPDTLKQCYFYLISSNGIESLKLVSLHGTASFMLKHKIDSLACPPSFFGFITASVNRKMPPTAGFALRSNKPLVFTKKKVKIDVRNFPSLLGYAHDEIVQYVDNDSTKFKAIKCFGFTYTDNDSLFAYVEWDVNGLFPCNFGASILYLGTSPEEIMWNTDGCDI